MSFDLVSNHHSHQRVTRSPSVRAWADRSFHTYKSVRSMGLERRLNSSDKCTRRRRVASRPVRQIPAAAERRVDFAPPVPEAARVAVNDARQCVLAASKYVDTVRTSRLGAAVVVSLTRFCFDTKRRRGRGSVVCDIHETHRASLVRILTIPGTKSKTVAAASSWRAVGLTPPRTSDTSAAQARRSRRLAAG